MCLKENKCQRKNKSLDLIIKDTKELRDILEEGKAKEKLYEYELIKLNSKYDIFDEKTRKLINITAEEYVYIIENYDKLINKYPDARERALRYFNYIKSINIAKILALKGCENCRLIVCEKLDVKEKDLCDNCKKLIARYKL